jgi:hypothetical protein
MSKYIRISVHFRKLSVLIILCLAHIVECRAESTTLATSLQSISSFSVNPSVKLPERIFYNGIELGIGAALGGVLGGLIASEGFQVSEQIKEFLHRQNIDVAKIVVEEFNRALQQDPKLASKIVANGQAQFNLEVYNWGLSRNGSFSTDYKVAIGIRAKLIDQLGATVWEGRDFVHSANPDISAKPFEAYFGGPEVFSDGLKNSSRIVSELLVKRMQ